METFALDATDLADTPDKKKRVNVSLEQEAAQLQDALVVYSPPKKRAKPGRPPAGTSSPFNLETFLEQHRPGMYRFLTEKEACDRLPSRKKTDPGFMEVEMRKRPAQCLCCGTYFHLPHLTNNVALNLPFHLAIFIQCLRAGAGSGKYGKLFWWRVGGVKPTR